MRKTSVYLSEEDRARLARLARARGRTQAEVLREALDAFERAERPDRNFALTGAVSIRGVSARDLSEEELLGGFGDDTDR